MNRRIFFQVAGPALVIGLVLLGACLVSAWYINRLQSNLAEILSQNVSSLRAAQELEIQLRRLRFHSFLNLIDPRHAPATAAEQDHELFEKALHRARELANQSSSPPEARRQVEKIETGYVTYRKELAQMRREAPTKDLRSAFLKVIDDLRRRVAREGPSADVGALLNQLRKDVAVKVPPRDLQKWVEDHPIRHVVEPCQKLLEINRRRMNDTFLESEDVSGQARLTMLLVGLVGPAAGLIMGFGIARGLSRSIYQLSVRVQDMAQRLDRDVASVSIAADGDLNILDRQLAHVVHHVEEVAERLQRQQRDMLRAEQLSAVGQLAAGVAHEVRNPLTSVSLLVESALRSHNRKPLTMEDLHVIHAELARLNQTVQGFLDFARPPTLRRSPVVLGEVITQAIELVRVRARQQGVDIIVRSPDEPIAVFVDRSQICNVLVNLFLNALDAMPQGGRLTVELEPSVQEVQVRVNDTGAGISPEIAGRLFTPFASSKPTGTGLGLSISRRIIEEHGGQIHGGNWPEGGARFTITLPATSPTNSSSRTHESIKGPPHADVAGNR
jgi:signal transduction histidine kinase